MAKSRNPPTDDPIDIEGWHPVLDHLAERVRTVRSGRGMSRKALAKQAQISERYLAQLEAGKGNISVLLLYRVARALGIPLPELLDERDSRPADAALLDTLLGRMSAAQRSEARNLLLSRFGGASQEQRRDRIALIGLRGGGKSTLGKLLAERRQAPFIELDREIEAVSGLQLAEIFELFGQETFRRTEFTALEAALHQHPRFVLATGGSLVTERATFELLLASCTTVWVRAAPGEHMDRVVAQGDLRPMADNARAMDDLLSILKSREQLYARADITLDTAGKTPIESLAALMAQLARDRSLKVVT